MSREGTPFPVSARAAASHLASFLGDPLKPGGPYSYHDIVASEEHGELPPGAIDAIRQWGFQDFLVPVEHGGRLRTLEELFWVTRSISQRNLTIAVVFGSALLGANPVWLWGSDEQKANLAEALRSGQLVCFAVSEADHGSDVLATETIAPRDGDELALTGVKWPVGNATRARFVTVFARTDGDAKFSLLLVDKERLAPESWSVLPLAKTVGLRGHDLSGISFQAARLPCSAVIGHEGVGLVQTLKTLQITRTAIAGLSVGTMDAAIRITLDYAHERRLYGQPIYALPIIRDHLLKAQIDVLIAECVVTPATRALSIAPDRLSLWSSIVKYFVPVLAEEVVASMGTVLGARGYLREGVAYGIFQKLQRDHAIAAIFEGTTHVNLHVVADQLPFIVAKSARAAEQHVEARHQLLTDLFSMTEDAPVWQPDGSRLRLTNEGLDEVTSSWQEIGDDLAGLARSAEATEVIRDLIRLVDTFSALRERTYAAVESCEDYDSDSVRAMAMAREHVVFHAAASALLIWRFNRDALRGDFAQGGWLVLCLERLLQRLRPSHELSTGHLAAFEQITLACLRQDENISLHAFGNR
jgi:alkylation response protein AidB-like acyl-CoA dehydrogenase